LILSRHPPSHENQPVGSVSLPPVTVQPYHLVPVSCRDDGGPRTWTRNDGAEEKYVHYDLALCRARSFVVLFGVCKGRSQEDWHKSVDGWNGWIDGWMTSAGWPGRARHTSPQSLPGAWASWYVPHVLSHSHPPPPLTFDQTSDNFPFSYLRLPSSKQCHSVPLMLTSMSLKISHSESDEGPRTRVLQKHCHPANKSSLPSPHDPIRITEGDTDPRPSLPYRMQSASGCRRHLF
jgi:hypothetical protein